MALKRKAISPSGTVVEISLATGKAIRNMMGNTYAQMIQHEKERRGWVWYDSMDDDAREALISSRQATHTSEQSEYAQMFSTKLDRLAEVLERGVAGPARPAVTSEQLAEAMAVSARPKKEKDK